MGLAARPNIDVILILDVWHEQQFYCTTVFRPELNILAFQPWTNLETTHKVDQSVDEVSIKYLLLTLNVLGSLP